MLYIYYIYIYIYIYMCVFIISYRFIYMLYKTVKPFQNLTCQTKL